MKAGLSRSSTIFLHAGGLWLVISIEGMIDLGLAPFLSRTIREAEEAGAAAAAGINTFGGRVDATVAMRDTLLNAPVRTIAFVNQRHFRGRADRARL